MNYDVFPKEEFIDFVGNFLNFNPNITFKAWDSFSVELANKFGQEKAYEMEINMFKVDGEPPLYESFEDYNDSLNFKTNYLNGDEV